MLYLKIIECIGCQERGGETFDKKNVGFENHCEHWLPRGGGGGNFDKKNGVFENH